MSVLSLIEKNNRTYPLKWNVRDNATITALEPVSEADILGLLKNNKKELLKYGELEGITGLAITIETVTNLPGFRTPIMVDFEDHLYSVADFRGITNIEPSTRKLVITNDRTFRYETFRLATQSMYLFEPDVLESVSPLYGKVLIRLITQTLGRSFKLDPEEQNKIRYLVANYWLTNFEHIIDEATSEEQRVKDGRINRISRIANTTPELYRLVHDGSPILSSDLLVNQIIKVIDSPKIKHLDTKVFVNMVSRLNNINPETGYNMVVGIDHPPTYYANILIASIVGVKTALAEIIKDTLVANRDSRDGIKELVRLIDSRIYLED